MLSSKPLLAMSAADEQCVVNLALIHVVLHLYIHVHCICQGTTFTVYMYIDVHVQMYMHIVYGIYI